MCRNWGGTELEQVEFQSGLLFASHAVAMAVFSPIWGSVADRYGRKLMVERAMFSEAVLMGAMGFVQNVQQLMILPILQGLPNSYHSSSDDPGSQFHPSPAVRPGPGTFADGYLHWGFGRPVARWAGG
jgi:DHA1 family multidrug resistance protein-like MFS transporter